MFVCLYYLKGVLEASTWWLIALILIGIAIYALCLLILRDPLFFELCGKVFGKVFRRRHAGSAAGASAAEGGEEAEPASPEGGAAGNEHGMDDGKK